MEILKEIIKAFDRNADYWKGTINYKEEPRKVRKFFAKIKVELKVINTRINNAKEGISDLKDRTKEITWNSRQKAKWKKLKQYETHWIIIQSALIYV